MKSIKSTSFGLIPIVLFFFLPQLRKLIQQSYKTNNDNLRVFHPTFPPTELDGKDLELWFNEHIANHKVALPNKSLWQKCQYHNI